MECKHPSLSRQRPDPARVAPASVRNTLQSTPDPLQLQQVHREHVSTKGDLGAGVICRHRDWKLQQLHKAPAFPAPAVSRINAPPQNHLFEMMRHLPLRRQPSRAVAAGCLTCSLWGLSWSHKSGTGMLSSQSSPVAGASPAVALLESRLASCQGSGLSWGRPPPPETGRKALSRSVTGAC